MDIREQLKQYEAHNKSIAEGSVLSRLVHVINELDGLTPSVIAQKLKIDRSTPIRWLNGSIKKIDSELLGRFALKFPFVSGNWLLTGIGSMWDLDMVFLYRDDHVDLLQMIYMINSLYDPILAKHPHPNKLVIGNTQFSFYKEFFTLRVDASNILSDPPLDPTGVSMKYNVKINTLYKHWIEANSLNVLQDDYDDIQNKLEKRAKTKAVNYSVSQMIFLLRSAYVTNIITSKKGRRKI